MSGQGRRPRGRSKGGGLGALGPGAITPSTALPPGWVSCGMVLTHLSPPSPATEDPDHAGVLPGHVR